MACSRWKTRSPSQFYNQLDYNAYFRVNGADPFFVNKAAGDFRVRTNSPAYNTGTALPAAVAFAVGVTAVSPVSRGAITWPTP